LTQTPDVCEFEMKSQPAHEAPPLMSTTCALALPIRDRAVAAAMADAAPSEQPRVWFEGISDSGMGTDARKGKNGRAKRPEEGFEDPMIAYPELGTDFRQG
jgi:hypothetical protein